MTKLAILNDTHIGAQRRAGTTPRSAAALSEFQRDVFTRLLDDINSDLLILGDLFDTFSVPYVDLIFVWRALSKWLDDNEGFTLHLVPGNHDLSKDSSKLSSMQCIAALFADDGRVVYYAEPGPMRDHRDYWVIPHLPNQDLFDIALKQVPYGTEYLFLHANYDNGFAAESDHSLNVSADTADEMLDCRLVFAHEHQSRIKGREGNVLIPGNQIPTSVADCLGARSKSRLSIDDSGHPEWTTVFRVDDIFKRIDWREIEDSETDPSFIRVEGEASAQEAKDVIEAIAKLRRTSTAFVITNAVKIEGVCVTEDAAEALAEAKGQVDTLAALLELLDEPERVVVLDCMEKMK